ncbi:ECF transporter S component [Niallia sp. 03133]|uniref:ECF transporter S component n=1 Tax=Niallia sp. 03133 TaxID=3458060 RepID=UPI0040450C46
MNKKNKTLRIVLLSMFTSIVILQTTVPFLGLIPIGPLSITIIQITIMIAAIVLGPKEGAIVGGVWGVITFVRAFTFPTSPIAPIVFTNPLISIVPRILIGVVAGFIFHKLLKNKIKDAAAMSIAGIAGSLTNTLLVLGLIYIFYRDPYANYLKMDISELLPALLGIVGTNGVTEAILSAIFVPIISKTLMKIRK